MATTVKITETYDLKTTVNKLGLIGIHTPSSSLVSRLYPGLCKNHKFIRVQKCDVVGVCASVLPADPLQIGVEAGDVAPEDMFNPILYKPVSNQSFETIVNRMYAGNDVSTLGSVSLLEDAGATNFDPFEVYYSFLAETKRWKKSMPQHGFGLRGLYPICYQMINQYGNVAGSLDKRTVIGSPPQNYNITPDQQVAETNGAYNGKVLKSSVAFTFRGKSVRMPALPLHEGPEYGKFGMGDFSEWASFDASEVGDFTIPRTFVAMFIIPPARLHEFYYRMRVTWTLTFSGVCTTNEIGNYVTMQSVTGTTYAKNFSYQSSKTEMENERDLVDTTGVSINKIMES